MVLLAHGRAKVLRRTLQSLSQVRGFSTDLLLVAQDGDDAGVSAVLEEHRLSKIQHMQPPLSSNKGQKPPPWKVGATMIARHYKWTFEQAFQYFSTAPGLIVLEDDLMFSPDFLDYFQAAAQLLNVV